MAKSKSSCENDLSRALIAARTFSVSCANGMTLARYLEDRLANTGASGAARASDGTTGDGSLTGGASGGLASPSSVHAANG